MAEPIIRVENLSKKYSLSRHQPGRGYSALRDVLAEGVRSGFGMFRRSADGKQTEDFWALQSVNFEVAEGEVVGIIGRNGAGKSTLLKVLSRITEPTSGRITLNGHAASLLEVGTGFHPELTGRENVFLNGTILGMSRAETARKFDEIVAFAEVEKFLDTPVKRYSSGMYVRLAFSVAAHLEQEILIVDEVLAVGDAAFQKKCLGKMGEVARGGRTVLFVSHNMPSVRAFCTTGIMLQKGEVRSRGPITDVLEAYAKELADVHMGAIVEWPAGTEPGSADVKLVSFSVRNVSREVASVVEFSDPFVIAIRYKVSVATKGVRVGIVVKDSYGTEVFGSSDYTERTGIVREPGVYAVECVVPGHTLNSGRFSVTLGADICPGNEPLWLLEDCVYFEIEDHVGHGPTNVRPPGIVRPNIRWTERITP